MLDTLYRALYARKRSFLRSLDGVVSTGIELRQEIYWLIHKKFESLFEEL